jgi:hypothetical protein
MARMRAKEILEGLLLSEGKTEVAQTMFRLE